MSSSSSYRSSDDESSEDLVLEDSRKRPRKQEENPKQRPPTTLLPSTAIRKKTKPTPNFHESKDDASSSSSSIEKRPPTRRVGRKRMLRAMQPRPAKAAAAPKESDSEWEESEDESVETNKKNPIQKKKSIAGTTSNKKSARPNLESESQTEVLFIKTILEEEVQAYIQQHNESIPQSEKDSLDQWVSSVNKELEQQNQVVLENIDLVGNLKKVSRRCNQLQDKLLVQKKTIQATKKETQATEGQVKAAKLQETKAQSANRFLLSLRNLARAD